MLIRKANGNEFHVVECVSEDQRAFVCLCGERVLRNCVRKQVTADGPYQRCWLCRKAENERVKESLGQSW